MVIESQTQTLLPPNTSTVDGYVNYKGRPISRFSSGGWRSASFIIVVEVAERFAYYGISSNLITYLSGPIGETTAAAAANVNAWSGVASLLPLLGAFVADSFLGRYWTIVFASLVYILGLGLLTLSALLTSFTNWDCQNKININSTKSSCSPPEMQIFIFFLSLYLVAFGQGGHKPCVQAFGADQFDENNLQESKAKSSFFNWWYLSFSSGITLSIVLVVYIQDNLNWALGFGVPCAIMVASLVVFLLGTRTYRYTLGTNEQNPFARIGRVFVAALRNRKATRPLVMDGEEEAPETALPDHQTSSQQFKFLNKALVATDSLLEDGKFCKVAVTDIEEAKALLRLIPIWTTCLAYGMVFAQTITFFTKQGATMDRTIFQGFKIPAATLQLFIGIAIIIFIPIYDRVFVPVTRTLTRFPSGITMLQRIGTGMVLSAICMIVAGFVELKRMETAEKYGLIDKPNETIPMSFWWLVPQYLLLGLADVFTIVGLQEFFYDQVPKELRSLGVSLYLSIMGIGSLLSSLLVSTIDEVSSANGGVSWFANNLNQAHLDYFYWLLAGLSVVGFAVYLYFAKTYIYKSHDFSFEISHLIFPLLISIAASIDGLVICDGVTIAFFGSEQSRVGDYSSSSSVSSIATIAYSETSSDSSWDKFVGALLNSLVFVAVVTIVTFILVLLFYLRCTKLLKLYMAFSSFVVLGFMGGEIVLLLIEKFNVPIDSVSFLVVLYNFAVVGVLAVFMSKVAILVTQSYLVVIGMLVAYWFILLPEWTTWVLLVALALYDLAIVLLPVGPLRLLVELAVWRDEDIPTLVYEAWPVTHHDSDSTSNGVIQRRVWRERRNVSHDSTFFFSLFHLLPSTSEAAIGLKLLI
ncbi:hypothetical protein LWI28_026541 [Acer negundo]|uniref:Uncharacterized protein n=2 Tax=Acer negundo TaxID=4023 RepID=A0AAD5JKJ8_ACENE|nr:hypothetical protein LWI28_026541 [Acer negundo]KAK4859417.1 hypothetical protein QYF36_005056 [Acer negundo]